MIKIEFPDIKPRIKKENDRELIFCAVRKKWLTLTPEEWVRQNFILYLNLTLGYPLSLIAVEKSIKVAERTKRFDIVAYKNDEPYLLAECKEMNVPLSEHVALQALRYNIPMQTEWMIVTNGIYTAAFQRKNTGFVSAEDLPSFK